MKLKKLEIKNIASFENAVVDFDDIPLKNADLVLINGETGSGKSTILDAVCLALYADTPRLHNSQNQADKDDMPEGISFNDPRRLLRINTGSGYARLTFEAGGKDWLAEWEVRRARDKATGALQKKNWKLEDLTSHKVITKDNEIKSTISRLVGLDFTQFCRTTMLSQGEFAAFLKSRPEDKADILQKITGVDRFQQIGKMIYTITSEKNSILAEIRNQKENLEREALTPENRLSLEEEKRIHEQNKKNAEEKKEKLVAAKKWADDEADIRNRLTRTQKELTQAEENLKTEGVISASERISLYDRTGDVRTIIAALSKSEKDELAARGEINDLKSTFAKLSGSLQTLHNSVDDSEKTLEVIRRNIEDKAELKEIFDYISVINGECSDLAKWKKEIAANKKELEATEIEIRDIIRHEIKKLSENVQNSTKKKQDLENQLQLQEEILESCDLSGKRKLKDGLAVERQQLTELEATTRRMETCDGELNKLRQDISAANEAIASATKQSADASQAVIAAKSARDTQQKAFDSAQLAAGKSAQEMRATLNIGDVCPICGNEITHELKSDRLLRELAEQAKAVLEELKQRYEDALTLYTKHQKTLELKMKESAKYKEELERKSADRIHIEEALSKGCKALNITHSYGNDLAALKEILAARTNELKIRTAQLDKELRKGEEINKGITQLRKDLSKSQEALDAVNNRMVQAEKKRTDADNKVAALNAKLQTIQGNIDASMVKIEKIIGDKQVSGYDFRSDPIPFAEDLNKVSAAYLRLLEDSTRLADVIENLKEVIGRCEDKRSSILADIPQWREIEYSVPAKVDSAKTENGFDRLRSGIIAATAKLNKAREDCRTQRAEIDSFFISHPELNRTLVESVAELSETVVANLRSMVQNASNRVAQCKTMQRNISAEYADLLRKKPEWLILEDFDIVDNCEEAATDEENSKCIHVSELPDKIRECEKIITESATQSALIQKMFDDAAKHTEKLEAILTKFGKAQDEYSRWDQLNRLLGDAQGKRFSNIALSHVLANLIHDANTYMAQLDDRYELDVVPGQFAIMVCDRYQGYTQRTANTISGGETFIVSLALALALSNIGQLNGCDMLFIDEGFGSLSGGPLDKAINTLKNLHRQDGRRIGIISHITELREKIPTQLIVERTGTSPASIRLLH